MLSPLRVRITLLPQSRLSLFPTQFRNFLTCETASGGTEAGSLLSSILEAEAGMPRYYFDLRDSSGLWADEEGIELRNLSAAQDEAARSLGDMARDAVRHINAETAQEMTVEVRDDVGPVMHVRFSFEIERKN
jgi:hypothetical protein